MQERAESKSRRVVIGMDPHKRSVTIEMMSADEAVVGVTGSALTKPGSPR
jgi:hypothetical protein